MKKIILKKKINNIGNIFKGNNKCTYKKCPKSVQNMYTFLENKSKTMKTSIINLKKNDKIDILYDKYNKLLNNIKKKKTYKKYIDCTCNLCKNKFSKFERKEDIFQSLDLMPDFDKKINVKKYINKSIKLSKKIKDKINQTCD